MYFQFLLLYLDNIALIFIPFQRRAITPLSDVSPNTSIVEKKKKKKKKDIDTSAAEDVTVKTEPEDNGVDAVS